jgi:putative ABC transport system permease protein
VSIDLANTSAATAFQLSAETVTGKATHQIVGTAGTLDEDVYRRVRVEAGVQRAAPVVEGYATVGRADRTFQVLGVDPFAEGPFRPYLGAGPGGGLDLATFLTQPTALLSRPTATTIGAEVGDTLQVSVEGTTTPVAVAGLIEPEGERTRRAIANLLVVDVATAQAVFDQTGTLTRVDLIVPDGRAGDEMLGRIRSVLPEGARVQRSKVRTETVEQMTRAFDLNLTALSLLALVVGAFLIYNTMTFSVVQRRGLIGRLRALGVTRRQVFRLVLTEAALLGVVGTGLGLLLGIALATGLVQLIAQTINDLYFVVSVQQITIAPWTLAKGAVLGVGTTVLAAVAPAREATNAPVSTVLRRSTQETGIQDAAPKLAGAGAALAVLGTAILVLTEQSIVLSYAALLFLLVAAALATPLAVIAFSKGLRPLLGSLAGVLGRMAARGVVSTLSRTGVAVAALMIAVASTVGVGVMIDSFRGTVVQWLTQSLQADVYVQPPSLVFRRSNATLERDVVDRLREVDGIASSHTVRRVDVQSPLGPTELVAIQPGPQIEDVYQFKTGDPEAVWRSFVEEDFVLISEPYAYRHDLAVGDSVTLQTDRGAQRFPIRAVYYDYGSDLGVVLASRTTYTRYYDDRGLSGIAFYARDDVDVDALIADMRVAVRGMQDVIIRSNKALRETSLKVFDRTFTITTVLRLLAVFVAFIGVLSALMALALERSREFGVLRATGMTPAQVGGYVTLQTSLMGAIAGLLSIPLGYVLAYVLVYVINKRSFGWTLQLSVAPEILLQALAVAVAAAFLAGLYPAWKMARSSPALALRDE